MVDIYFTHIVVCHVLLKDGLYCLNTDMYIIDVLIVYDHGGKNTWITHVPYGQ